MVNDIDFILNKKNNLIIQIWSISISVLLIIILSFCIFYHYKIYEDYQGIIVKQDNVHYLNLYLTDEQIRDFNYQKIYIDQKEIKKKITNISQDYILNDTGKYRLLTLDINDGKIDQKYLINNNVITVKIYKRNTTIMKEIINKLLKGGHNAEIKQ